MFNYIMRWLFYLLLRFETGDIAIYNLIYTIGSIRASKINCKKIIIK